MRISVNACRGCNADKPLMPDGWHLIGKGYFDKCAFVEAEVADLREDERADLVYRNKRGALRRAKIVNGSLLWIGQAPINMWLVVTRRETHAR